MVEQLRLAHHPVGALQQEVEQHELPRREIERFAADLGDAPGPVEGECAELDERRLAARGASREGAYPRFQLLERERLGEVIVRPEVEAAHTGFDTVLRGEDQDGQLAAAPAKALQDLEAVHPGKADVEDQQVEFEARYRAIGLGAGGDAVHRVPVLAQAHRETIGQDRVVFGDQNPHPARPPFAVSMVASCASSRATLNRV